MSETMHLVNRNYPYAWRYAWAWIWGYMKQGKVIAALRTVYWSLLLGHMGEACGDCGRIYPNWWAPDDLWQRVYESEHSYKGGLCCIGCFDKKASRLGVILKWRPEENLAREER